MICLGNSLAVLMVGRALQGLSAAVVWTVGLALIVDTVGPTELAQMMGYISLSMSIAILAAPLFGGVVYEKGGYYAVFYLSFGMIILDIILRLLLIERKIAQRWAVEEAVHPSGKEITSIDPSATPNPELHSPSEAPDSGPLAGQRSIPPALTLLSSRRLLSALWCTLIQSILMTSWDATLPLRVANLFGWNSLGAGLIFLPFVLPSFMAPLIGIYVDRKGPRLPAALGFFLAVPPLVLLRLVNHSGIRQMVLLCGLLALLGFTLTMAMVPFLAEVAYVVVAKEKARPGTFGNKGAYAQAYGIYNCAFSGGMVLGPIWGGFLVRSAGWGTMAWSLAVLSAFSVIPAALWTGGWIGPGKSGRVPNATGRKGGVFPV
jgi:MFS family permease